MRILKESKMTVETKVWTREKVMELTRDEVIELWKRCPAVDRTGWRI